MFKHILAFFFLAFLLFNLHLVKAINPKSLVSLDAELTLSGDISISGTISSISIRIYIPQEGVKRITVSPSNWKFVEDNLKNKMIMITWQNPTDFEKYEVKFLIENKAKFFENLSTENWFLEETKKETESTKADDEMREFAYGKENNLEKALRLTQWLEQNFAYDYDFLKNSSAVQRSAMEIWKIRKAVSGEFSNLLVSLLRTQGIPARVIFSYTFPEIKEDFEQDVGHGWAEAYIDGKWIPLDVTFFEAGYLDAAHIKFANLLENNITETLTVVGNGKAEWQKNPLRIKILNYKTFYPELKLKVNEEIKGNQFVIAEGEIKGLCMLERLTLNSCIDKFGKSFFKIFEPKRKFWLCNNESIFWILQAPEIETNRIYTCDLTLREELGSSIGKTISISGMTEVKENIILTGPNQVLAWEKFILESDVTGIFFSPNTTKSINSNKWELSFDRAGRYKLYFYSAGRYGEKDVEVLSKKDFMFISVNKPENITQNQWFLVNTTIKNIASQFLSARIKIEFQNQTIYEDITLNPNRTKNLSFNLTAYQIGKEKILLLIEDKTLSSYTTSIEVLKKETVFRKITNPLLEFLQKIIEFLRRLFSITLTGRATYFQNFLLA